MYINIYISHTSIPIYILNSREISFSSIFLVLTTKDTAKKKKQTFPTSKFRKSTFGDSNVLKVLAEISHKANRPSDQRTLLGSPQMRVSQKGPPMHKEQFGCGPLTGNNHTSP